MHRRVGAGTPTAVQPSLYKKTLLQVVRGEMVGAKIFFKSTAFHLSSHNLQQLRVLKQQPYTHISLYSPVTMAQEAFQNGNKRKPLFSAQR
jgi:hypothetical protein